MSDAAFTRILSDLGEHLGIPALAPNDAGLCQLVSMSAMPSIWCIWQREATC